MAKPVVWKGFRKMNIKKHQHKKHLSYIVSGLYSLGIVATFFLAAQLSPTPQASAAGECSTGFYPKITSLVRNGSFAVAPADVFPAGSAGDSNAVPGHNYADADFYSQMSNSGYDLYPSDAGTKNVFSVQDGAFFQPTLDQVPFPGDPLYSIPASNTWLYTNGNILNGAEYLTWEQDVTGLAPNTQYVFVAYISNVIEPPFDAADDPTIRLRIGGTTGMPDGTVIGGPMVLTEAATANTQPLSGWQRVAFSFTTGPSQTTEKLKITDASPGWNGDDFAMTAINLSECVPVPDYAASLSHTGTPSQYGSYTQRVTVTNAGTTTPDDGHIVTITLPIGYTVNGGSAGPVTLTGTNGGYTCTADGASPQGLTCTATTSIPASQSRYVEFPVAIGASASANSTVNAAVVQQFDEVPANDTATDVISLAPDLRNQLSVVTHTDTTVTLKAEVANIGTYTTAGNDELELTLPDGIIVNGGAAGPVTISGPNAAEWTCTADAASPQVVTCIHAASIRNLTADDQEYLITLQIDPASTKTDFDFATLTSSTGDSNPANNAASTRFTITGNTDSTPDGDDDETLASTGVDAAAAIGAVTLLVIGGIVLLRRGMAA